MNETGICYHPGPNPHPDSIIHRLNVWCKEQETLLKESHPELEALMAMDTAEHYNPPRPPYHMTSNTDFTVFIFVKGSSMPSPLSHEVDELLTKNFPGVDTHVIEWN